MSNNSINGILTILCVALAIYVFILRAKLEKIEYEMLTARVLVERSESQTKELKRLADANVEEAQRQTAVVRKQLEECLKSKR